MRETEGPSLWLHVAMTLRDAYGMPFVCVNSRAPGARSPAAFIEVPSTHRLLQACNDATAA